MGKKLTAKQAAALSVTLYYPILAKGLVPLTARAGRGAFLAPLFAAIPLLAQAVLIRKLQEKFPGRSIGEILEQLFGRRVSRGILILLALWLILSAAGYMEHYDELLTSTIYPDARHDLMPILMAVLVGLLLPKGLCPLGRMNWIIAWIVLVQMGFLFILMLPKCRVLYLLPIGVREITNSLLAAPVTASSVGGVFLSLFLLQDEVQERPEDQEKNRRRWILLFAGIILVPAVLLMALTSSFSGPVLKDLDWPVLSVVREIFDLEGSASLEPLFVAIWFYADFMSVALQSYLAVKLLAMAFHIRDFRQLLPAGVILILSVTLCFSGGIQEMRAMTGAVLLPVRLIISFGLPALCCLRIRKIKVRPLQEGKNMVE